MMHELQYLGGCGGGGGGSYRRDEVLYMSVSRTMPLKALQLLSTEFWTSANSMKSNVL